MISLAIVLCFLAVANSVPAYNGFYYQQRPYHYGQVGYGYTQGHRGCGQSYYYQPYGYVQGYPTHLSYYSSGYGQCKCSFVFSDNCKIFLRRFKSQIWDPKIENRVPGMRESYREKCLLFVLCPHMFILVA